MLIRRWGSSSLQREAGWVCKMLWFHSSPVLGSRKWVLKVERGWGGRERKGRSTLFPLLLHPRVQFLTPPVSFVIFILYWSTVDWKCWVSFRCTAKWFSYAYTCTHSFQVIFLYRSLQNIEEFAELYSRSLVIYFICSSVYLLIPLLGIHPENTIFWRYLRPRWSLQHY